MAEQSAGKAKAKGAAGREDRLKAALKANMARRKAQARGRAAEAEQDRTGQDAPDGETAENGE